ncbi:MAG: OmpH family outer membrane protein [Bacteroidales bacterium]|nr:OmpH family outer membrane protein [Bacteroidales bacterium]MDD3724020.1 OmpH family outer membrane protein [Bacteroidales bacterium]
MQEEMNNVQEEISNIQEENQEFIKNKTKQIGKNQKIFSFISVLSLIGVIVVIVLFIFKGNNISNDNSSTPIIQNGELRIAYVDTDSIMLQYEYAKDLEQGLKSYQKQLESSYEGQLRKLQTDFENYQKTGDKLTLTEQRRKEEDLMKRQQELPEVQQRMMSQLQERQVEDNKKLLNSVYAFIKDYNSKNKKFNIILSKSYVSSSVLYADQGLDITKEIIKGLNQEYKDLKK